MSARRRRYGCPSEAREKARKLAEEIPRYLPDFTDHSLDHMDSLWRIADHIVPENYPVSLAEAFVFGCAVLGHDCAMSGPDGRDPQPPYSAPGSGVVPASARGQSPDDGAG